MLSYHIEMICEGHLQQVHHIFDYFRQNQNSRLVLDPTYPFIDKYGFEAQDWRYVYGNVYEGILNNAPKELVKVFW